MKLEERAEGQFLDDRKIIVKDKRPITEINLLLREGECPERRFDDQIKRCAGECFGTYVRMAFDKSGTLRAIVGLADAAEPYLRRDVGRALGFETDEQIMDHVKYPDVVWQELFINGDVRGRQAMYDGAELMRTYTSCTLAIHPGNEKKFEKEAAIAAKNFERILLYAKANPRHNK